MSTQTKSVHLYGKPTKCKLSKLKQLEEKYKQQVNKFTEILVDDPKYYDIIFDNAPQSDKAGKFEKKYRGDFKSAYRRLFQAWLLTLGRVHTVTVCSQTKVSGQVEV